MTRFFATLALFVSAIAFCFALLTFNALVVSCSKQSERERIEKEISVARDSIAVYQQIVLDFIVKPCNSIDLYLDDNGEKIPYNDSLYAVLFTNCHKSAREKNKSVRDRRIYFQSLLDSLQKSLPPE